MCPGNGHSVSRTEMCDCAVGRGDEQTCALDLSRKQIDRRKINNWNKKLDILIISR